MSNVFGNTFGNNFLFHKGSVLNPFLKLLSDGNTVGWYDYRDLPKVIKDGNNLISSLKDKTILAHDLVQSNESYKPTWTYLGVKNRNETSFTQNFLKAEFTFQQPETIYVVMKIRGLIDDSNIIIDGKSATEKGILNITKSNSATQFRINAGLSVVTGVAFTVGQYQVYKLVFNGANSSLTVEDAISTFNAGTENMNGFCIGARYDATGPAQITYTEIILRKSIDTEEDSQLIFDTLSKKYKFYRKIMGDSYSFTAFPDVEIPIEENEAMNNALNSYSLDLSANNNVPKYYSLYDALCTNRTQIGTSVLGVPIYSYRFGTGSAPYKLLIMTGTHGSEHASIWCAYKLMKYLYGISVDDSRFNTLKGIVDITVVPCVNPDGINSRIRTNENTPKVDINRNFPVYFENNTALVGSDMYGGSSPLSEPESQAIAAIIGNYDISIDFHNNGGGTFGSPIMVQVVSESVFANQVLTTQEPQLINLIKTKFASMSAITDLGYAWGLQEGIIQNYPLLALGKLGIGLEVGDANPFVGTEKYTAELCDINEYIAFNIIYKLVVEYNSHYVD